MKGGDQAQFYNALLKERDAMLQRKANKGSDAGTVAESGDSPMKKNKKPKEKKTGKKTKKDKKKKDKKKKDKKKKDKKKKAK
mgnify:CR=1 FL=1